MWLRLPAAFWLLRVLAQRGYTQLRGRAGRRLHHLGRALRRDARRPARLRALLSAGNAARSALGRAGLGRRDVESWRHDRPDRLHLIGMRGGTKSRGPISAIISSSSRRSACSLGRCANFINGELYGRADACAVGDAFPEGIARTAKCRRSRSRRPRAAAKVNPSLTTPEAIVNGLHSQPQLREVLRPILTPRHPSQTLRGASWKVLCFSRFSGWCGRERASRTVSSPDCSLSATRSFGSWWNIFASRMRRSSPGFTRGQFFSFFLIAIGLAFIIVGKIRNRRAPRRR